MINKEKNKIVKDNTRVNVKVPKKQTILEKTKYSNIDTDVAFYRESPYSKKDSSDYKRGYDYATKYRENTLDNRIESIGKYFAPSTFKSGEAEGREYLKSAKKIDIKSTPFRDESVKKIVGKIKKQITY